MIVVIVRALRPWLPLVAMAFLIVFRALQSLTDPDDRQGLDQNREPDSLLRRSLSLMEAARHHVLLTCLNLRLDPVFHSYALKTFTYVSVLFEDVLALLMLWSAARLAYVLYHVPLSDWGQRFSDTTFLFLKQFSFVSNSIQTQLDDLRPTLEKSMGKGGDGDDRGILTVLPKTGRDAEAVTQQLQDAATTENEKWESGKVSGTVYAAGTERSHWDMLAAVYKAYSTSNPLHAGLWPRLNQCEAEVIAMTANMMSPQCGNGKTLPVGSMTSGGTESIMLAIKAHWQLYGTQRGINHPELICGSTAHASVGKACGLYGIRMVVIDCDDGDTTNRFQLSPELVRKHITSNTIMIFASAPSYPQGTIDPIEELGKIAQKFDIGLHVDSCLGGFVLPFLSDTLSGESLPPFDFRVPGVTSMSADTHKYGYASKGTSVVLYRDAELRHAQYFCSPRWTGGLYCTPTFAGSRPGSLIACAWAALVSIGEDGYRDRGRQIAEASRKIADGIVDMEGIRVLGSGSGAKGEERILPSMVVCFGAENNPQTERPTLDVYRLLDLMNDRGWSLNGLQSPASIHVCVTLNIVPKVEEFLSDLRVCVVQAKKEASVSESSSKDGTAGIYGMAGSLPKGPINNVLCYFLDLLLSP